MLWRVQVLWVLHGLLPSQGSHLIAETLSLPLLELQVEESHSFIVNSRCTNNGAGVQLLAGAHYEFCVAGKDTWRDLNIECTAGGWTAEDTRKILRPVVRAAEPRRRCPDANWFELIGSVGGDGCELFRIGCRGQGWTYTPRRSGPLYAFANDLLSRYDNNSGSITVTVRRLAAPSRCLPACIER